MAQRSTFPAWFVREQEAATVLMETKALPKAEKTNIKLFGYEHIVVETTEKTLNEIPTAVAHLVGEADENVVIINDGVLVYQKLDGSFNDVIITDLQTACVEHEALVKEYFMSTVSVARHQLSAQHVAHLNSGLFIYVPKNKVIDQPLNVVYVQERGSFVHHTLVIAETSSMFTYTENYVTSEQTVANVMSEVIVKPNASVYHASLDHFKKEAVVYSTKGSNVLANGRYQLSLGALNDGNAVYEVQVNLTGEAAFSEVKTVGISDGTQKQNLTIAVEHFAPYSEGYILNHGVSKDEGQLVFNGIGKINQGMHHSVAKQETHAMILSKTAMASANPILLIDEYDVVAGHAAGVGKIDEEQLYYLMSRGLTRQEAEVLIIYGFLMPFVDEIKNEKLQALFAKIIEQKLNL